jgi:hypothetical protein
MDWIKKDIYLPGHPFYTPSMKSYLKAVPNSDMERFQKMNEQFGDQIDKIMKPSGAFQHDPGCCDQQIDEMLEHMLTHTVNEPEMRQAAHFGVGAARLALKVMTNDTEGSSPLYRMISAIMNNTGSSRKTRSIFPFPFPPLGLLTDLAKSVVGGAAQGGLAGAAAGGVGAVPGAIAGATGGLAMGTANAAKSILGCFSTTSQVETLAGFKTLQEVAIGDFIRTSSPGRETRFTEVLNFGVPPPPPLSSLSIMAFGLII